ncbi:hypothetical protein L596_015934 [Steinernema carpocapsae]|uniref:G-protein coupled receptors family 1 profile domain-containing protein n=1 Tax=Steinernema carpocapsae TaxID=34508 RepID=A0A4U5NGG3_STECR|nr:hypothetical protein L596_015934 [Steinernema carpocapsae]
MATTSLSDSSSTPNEIFDHHIAVLVLKGIMFVVATPLNLWILWILRRRRSLREQTSNPLLFMIFFGELVLGVTGVPRLFMALFGRHAMTPSRCAWLSVFYIYGDVHTSLTMMTYAFYRCYVTHYVESTTTREPLFRKILWYASLFIIIVSVLITVLLTVWIENDPVNSCQLAGIWSLGALYFVMAISGTFNGGIALFNIGVVVLVHRKAMTSLELKKNSCDIIRTSVGFILTAIVFNVAPKWGIFVVMSQASIDPIAFDVSQVILGLCGQASALIAPLAYGLTNSTVRKQFFILNEKKTRVKNIAQFRKHDPKTKKPLAYIDFPPAVLPTSDRHRRNL